MTANYLPRGLCELFCCVGTPLVHLIHTWCTETAVPLRHGVTCPSDILQHLLGQPRTPEFGDYRHVPSYPGSTDNFLNCMVPLNVGTRKYLVRELTVSIFYIGE